VITRDDLSRFRAEMLLYCGMCMDEKPEGVRPQDWSRLSFGSFHKEGEPGIYLQLWCDRHDANVTTIWIQTGQWEHADHNPIRIEGASTGIEN